jgi:hypothetical protein
MCKKSRSCNICVNILGLGGELLVSTTTPMFVFYVRHCHWSSPSSFFVSSLGEQAILLPPQGLAPIVVWCSCVCDGWCYVSSCSLLSFFMCKKLEQWSSTLVVVITIAKDLQAFVAIILFKWAMSCLDPIVMVFFACSYVFQGDEALKLQWFQVSNAFCFCVHTALLLFVNICRCRFQKLGRGKLNVWLNLTCGGVHQAHDFLQMSKGMP